MSYVIANNPTDSTKVDYSHDEIMGRTWLDVHVYKNREIKEIQLFNLIARLRYTMGDEALMHLLETANDSWNADKSALPY